MCSFYPCNLNLVGLPSVGTLGCLAPVPFGPHCPAMVFREKHTSDPRTRRLLSAVCWNCSCSDRRLNFVA